jgi:hypothetical protein
VVTGSLAALRDAYLFHLHRLCHLDDQRIGALKISDFANLIDSIDQWVKVELRLKEVSPLG